MNEKYSTKDIYLAATLLAEGFDITKIDKTDVRHQEFFFNRPEEAELLERDYLNRKHLVEVTAFREAFVRLKAIIHVF